MVDAVVGWVEGESDDASVWDFSADGIFTSGIEPQLSQWFAWRDRGGMTPQEWRQQPLKQLVINNTLNFVADTVRLKGMENYQWASKFNATQLALVGWIDGSE